MMFWNTLLSGKALADWIMALVADPVANPNARFDKGQKLDPFQTSMRDAKGISAWLSDVEQGRLINRGGNGNQAYTDLKGAFLIEEHQGAHVLSILGRNVLNKWRQAGIDNSNENDDFSRMLLLVLEARTLSIQAYLDMLTFWSEIRESGSPISFILNPESLYLMGLLCNELTGFKPWDVIKRNSLQFQANGTIDQLRDAYRTNNNILSRLDKIEVWLQNSASRASGRQKFCLAMECAFAPIGEATALIESQNVTDLVGVCTGDRLKLFFDEYDLFNIRQNYAIKGENRIFYGAPGTGKSTQAKKIIRGSVFEVVTFHPATDYSSFVGYYKPISIENNAGEQVVQYTYQAQHFLRIYVKAWKDLANKHYLLIEEINRGNCAKIFGDIFQLLDRDDQGFSDYVINADSDVSEYLRKNLNNAEYKSSIRELVLHKNNVSLHEDELFSVLALPNNLSIIATMNTSDQSLFPMDSAFKRRWNWSYTPIITPMGTVTIQVNNERYDWFDFVQKANKKISLVTESEDKKIGNYFVKPLDQRIDVDTLVNKVMFYLWNDIFKEEYGYDIENNIFVISENDELKPILYSDLYQEAGINEITLQKLLEANKIAKIN
ncbi:AAA family ATPase [Cellvibrio sp. UBA7671]|uniref:AAA family ATPase n=1 Tax=Cellvibrio sp. UBA7671 TaxID=1946312 RepID=UPI002F359CCA